MIRIPGDIYPALQSSLKGNVGFVAAWMQAVWRTYPGKGLLELLQSKLGLFPSALHTAIGYACIQVQHRITGCFAGCLLVSSFCSAHSHMRCSHLGSAHIKASFAVFLGVVSSFPGLHTAIRGACIPMRFRAMECFVPLCWILCYRILSLCAEYHAVHRGGYPGRCHTVCLQPPWC